MSTSEDKFIAEPADGRDFITDDNCSIDEGNDFEVGIDDELDDVVQFRASRYIMSQIRTSM